MPSPHPQAPPQQSPLSTSALTHPLTPAERKAVADGWSALPVTSVSCLLLSFTNQLDIPLAELQPYLHRTLAKTPSLQALAPIGAPSRRLSFELGQGASGLEQAVEQVLVAYFSRRVLYEVEESMLVGITLELSSSALIHSASDLLAAVKNGDLKLSLSRAGASELARAG